MKRDFFSYKCYAIALWGVFFAAFLSPMLAYAGATDVDTITQNIITSSETLPGIVTACAYLLALMFAVTGVLKLKDHVENPGQTALRIAMARFLIGGALFALPMVYETIANTISGGVVNPIDHQASMVNQMERMDGSFIATTSALQDFNTILTSILKSLDETPAIITAGAYLFGLLMGVAGLLKIKDHIENPDQAPLREGVIRLLVGGAMFALPTIWEAVYQAVNSSGMSAVTALTTGTMYGADYAGVVGACLPSGGVSTVLSLVGVGNGASLGEAICGVILHANAFPAFLTFIGYLIGLGMTVWGILKLKAHVQNPGQVGLWEGLTRLLAAGMFFALPAIVSVAIATLRDPGLLVAANMPITTYNDGGGILGALGLGSIVSIFGGGGSCQGLDGMVSCFMKDILAPMNAVINFFAFSAGVVLIMIGISRLIKSAQEGAKGPLGMGTVMTFVAGGALCSYNELMRAATATFFTSPVTSTFGVLKYTKGMTPAETAHAHVVIASILKFMIVVGLISFVRGIFIIRGAAEGSQQASVMAGVTHMVGGALAVNLGPLINAVQATLGLTAYGIQFT